MYTHVHVHVCMYVFSYTYYDYIHTYMHTIIHFADASIGIQLNQVHIGQKCRNGDTRIFLGTQARLETVPL